MTPAEILRAAAARIREVAAARPVWPWGLVVDEDTGDEHVWLASFVDLWHPGVALAVADWLDAMAGEMDESKVLVPADVESWRAALTVARALLPDEGGS